jgi:hypothetical protein
MFFQRRVERETYQLIRHLSRGDSCIAFTLPPQHNGINQWLRLLSRDMSQGRDQLIEIRVRAWSAYFLYGGF